MGLQLGKMNKWPLWGRIVFVNTIAFVGAVIGFASSGDYARLSPSIVVPICTFLFALANLMFLEVVPRMGTRSSAGAAKPNPWGILYDVLSSKPLITLLLVIQLIGTSRTTASTIIVLRTSTSDYIRSLPNATSMAQRLIWSSVPLACVAFLWLLSAIGVWQRRLWAWWLALALNGLAATTTIALQFATTFLHLGKPSGFLLDLPSIAAVVLLLLPSVRTDFRKHSHGATSLPVGTIGSS
jgi:hypothetical protein